MEDMVLLPTRINEDMAKAMYYAAANACESASIQHQIHHRKLLLERGEVGLAGQIEVEINMAVKQMMWDAAIESFQNEQRKQTNG